MSKTITVMQALSVAGGGSRSASAGLRRLLLANIPLCLLTLMLMLSVPIQAQESSSPESVTENDIANLGARLEQSTDLDEQTLTDLKSQLNNASRMLQEASRFKVETNQQQTVISGAKETITNFRRQLSEAQASPPDPDTPALTDADATALESQLALTQSERGRLSDRLATVLKEEEQRAPKRARIQARLTALQDELADNRAALNQQAQTLQQQVVKALAQARRQALKAENKSLEAQILSEPARADIRAAERAWLNQALSDTDIRLQILSKQVELAQSNASRAKLEATAALQQEARNENPALQALIETNRILAEQLHEAAAEQDSARSNTRKLREQLDSIDQSSSLMRRRLEVAGRKEVLVRVMFNSLDNLPDTTTIERQIYVRNDLIANTSIAHIDTEEELRELANRDRYLNDHGIDYDTFGPSTQTLIDKALEQRQQLLETGLDTLGTLQRSLIDNNEQSQKLITSSRAFQQFLVGNLLWVRNFTFFKLDILLEQLQELTHPSNWIALPKAAYQGYHNSTWGEVLLGALILVMLAAWRIQKPFDNLIRKPTRLSEERFLNMIAGIIMSALRVAPVPALLWYIAYCLHASESNSTFPEAIAAMLTIMARDLYALLFTRKMIHPFGVGRRMLKWHSKMQDILRGELHWAGPVFILAGGLEAFAWTIGVAVTGGPLAAICNSILALMLSTFAIRLLREPLFHEVKFLRRIFILLAAIGASVIFMQLLGLLFAAEIYIIAVGQTLFVLFLIKIANDVVQRWLLVQRIRLERKRRDEQKSLEQSGESQPEDAEAWVDTVSLSEAHHSLLGLLRLVTIVVSVWIIWAPTLPGLHLLDGITVWEVTNSASADGSLRTITLADLLRSAFIFVVTILVAKNVPSVLQAFMVEWSKTSAGARYAFGILFQYFVLAVGGSMFLSAVGWEWSKLQWLVAALGVGIGFGLQEIVANFISGIIILFERPVRVGDIISVAGAEGRVLEIKSRATVIETFEGKEVLIPNKELITSQVVNWTLTGAAIRIMIPVGIGYGSDVRLAQALILEAATEVSLVIADPEPMVSFDDFGDNSLMLVLRCYAEEQRVQVSTDLRNLINDKLTKAGIEISFPQRDVHLDTLKPLQIEVLSQNPSLVKPLPQGK
ncbi:MAG: mechanosensitive ion channel domain-containing protein [Parahaliea sp.]